MDASHQDFLHREHKLNSYRELCADDVVRLVIENIVSIVQLFTKFIKAFKELASGNIRSDQADS